MRFVNAAGLICKSRRFVSGGGSVQDEEVKDPKKLAELIRQMQKRITELETLTPPEPIEFEVDVGYGGVVTELYHNFGSPVRWFVVGWSPIGGYGWPVDGPRLVRSHASTSNLLVLKSYTPGKAIIRVETAFTDVDLGASVSTNPREMALAAQYDTTSLTIVATPLTFAACLPGEVWDLKFTGLSGSSDVNGLKFAVHAPAGATVTGVHRTSTVNIATRQYETLAANTLGSVCHTIAGNFRDDVIEAQVRMGTTAGNVGISVAKVTAGIASIASGASLIMTRCTQV